MDVLQRAAERSREDLRASRGYGGPKFDPMPELIGFVAHLLLVGAILWSLGWF